MSEIISPAQARAWFLHAQGLDRRAPFGAGPRATTAAVEHLGYVQIDTIHVIERSHHHILYSRIPDYERAHLHHAQSVDKSVFEYWTHALAYVPTRDFRYFVPRMRQHLRAPSAWFESVKKSDLQRLVKRIREEGAISIRDVKDDVLQAKDHEWASRKPSKRALQWGFYSGQFAISQRVGMLKKYELLERHFGWAQLPKPASEKEIAEYYLDRALRAQGIVSLDSICHLQAAQKTPVKKVIEQRVKRGELVLVHVGAAQKVPHWMRTTDFEGPAPAPEDLVHILSPFDPLVIQRKRLKLFFDYDHVFEAYVPAEKRKFGYFTLPVLRGDRVVAAIDLKTDRQAQKLLVQRWTWVGKNRGAENKRRIEEELERFARFQLAGSGRMWRPKGAPSRGP